jgi:hypothetical protein
MIRLVKLLALAGITLGGAFLTTAAQASAANFNVSFAIHNADSTNSMIRTTNPLPTGVSGLNPIGAILPAGNDPTTGFATYSAGLPALNRSASVSLEYVNSGNSADECTFTIQVSNIGGLNPYKLHFSSDQARCTVPADQQNSTGTFTSMTSVVNWNG